MLRAIMYIAFLAAVCAIAAVLFFDDKQKTELKDYNALAESGLIEKGWLPNFLPKSIRNISEEHDLDSNIVTASFMIDPGDVGSFDSACRRSFGSDAQVVYECDYQDSEIIIKITKEGFGFLVGGPKRSHNKSHHSQP
jgi:hypothetical protein